MVRPNILLILADAVQAATLDPLIAAGPGIASGAVTGARVGLHDLCPTLLTLAGLPPFESPDSRSFAGVLRDPTGHEREFTTGYADAATLLNGQWFGLRIGAVGPDLADN